MRLQRRSNGQLLALRTEALLGAGGEARIFALPPGREFVAKIYHQPLPVHSRKLEVMLANPPDDPMMAQGHISIAWPLDLLHTSDAERRFAGYLMPRVSSTKPLFHYYNPASRLRLSPLFNYRYLHRAARNLAAAVRALHNRAYVIGDINESNILVTDTALITLVDTDSFQVMDVHSGATYRCPVGKPDYTPPELQGRSFLLSDRRPEHDLFGLAVLIFQLLMEGTHPFAGIYQSSGDPPPYQDRILAGHFPYGRRANPYLPMPLAPPLEMLHPTVRQLFLRCFEDGHASPAARPDAHTWQSVLQEAEEALQCCARNPQHLFGSHLSACPWCERTQLLGGRDPFPARVKPDAQRTAQRAGHEAPLAPQASFPGAHAMPPVIAPISTRSSSAAVNAPGAALPQLPALPKNLWAWGALGCAGAAVLTPPDLLPWFNLLAGLGAAVCGIIAQRAARRTPVQGRWLAGGAAGIGALAALAVTPHLITRSGASEVRFLSLQSGIRALAFSPDGKILTTGTNRAEDQRLIGGEVQEWDVNTGHQNQTLAEYPGNVVAVNYLPNGKSLLVGTEAPLEASEVDLLDAKFSGGKRILLTTKYGVPSVAVSPDGAWMASGGLDGDIHLWRADSYKEVPIQQWERSGEVFAVTFSPDSRTLAVATGSASGSVAPGGIRVIDLRTGALLWQQNSHNNAVTTLAFSPDGRLLATGGNDSRLRIWNAHNGSLLASEDAQTLRIPCLAFSPDGKRLASAVMRSQGSLLQNQVLLWNTGAWKVVRTLTGHQDRIMALAFAPNGKTLASAGLDATLRLWKLP